ncbi:pentapeptide repeat-containing protein [Rhodococcus pyridinivorans]|uniref:pentapeptide repeat-containing protein n=1 Tax=Rhodococcus pyridinivorans TaxID=103816 RepID=UPI001E46112D|nr:pentapeptide repeat-containing protein [Rhodococcus pyridinivorans]MCD5422662.1 pentapeptide repeat-containing protein [Rhodococcus pyridinivorans]
MNTTEGIIGFIAVVGCALAAWALCRTRTKPPFDAASDGLRLWFRASVGTALVAALALIALFVAGLKWDWLAGRYGGVLAPLGAIVAAAIASAGGARLAKAQALNADKTRTEDAEKELWSRFEGAAKQLADQGNFMIRVAGVYAFVGLADDWLRHHDRRKRVGVPTARVQAECETITDTLCAYLRQNTHKTGTEEHRAGERVVNEAIISQFRTHLFLGGKNRDGIETEKGAWAGHGLQLDLHGVDLERSYFDRMDLKRAILTRSDLFDVDLTQSCLDGADLRKADLCGADLSGASVKGSILDGVKYDANTTWPTSSFGLPPGAQEITPPRSHVTDASSSAGSGDTGS